MKHIQIICWFEDVYPQKYQQNTKLLFFKFTLIFTSMNHNEWQWMHVQIDHCLKGDALQNVCW